MLYFLKVTWSEKRRQTEVSPFVKKKQIEKQHANYIIRHLLKKYDAYQS
jgi:hypothetical protein